MAAPVLPEAAPAPAAPPVIHTITTTLGQLVEAETALDALLLERLPVKTAYHVAKLARVVRVETAFFHEQRSTLIKELGAEAAPTEAERAAGASGIVRVKPENLDEFARRMTDLGGIVATVVVRPLTLDALTCPMSGADLLRLGPLLVEDPLP